MLRRVIRNLTALLFLPGILNIASIVQAQPPATSTAAPGKLALDSEPYSLFMESSPAGVTYKNVTDEQVQQIVKSLKLFSHGDFGGGVATKYPDGRPREIVFAGADNKVVVRPGETKFVAFPRPCNVFFWHAGDAPDGIGDEDAEPKPAHEKMTHVCCKWDLDGKVTWSTYGPAPFFSADKPKGVPAAKAPVEATNSAVESPQGFAGEWELVEVKPMPKEAGLGARHRISGDTWITMLNGVETFPMQIDVRPETSPPTIDLIHKDQKGETQTWRALYRVREGHLELYWSPKADVRPGSYDAADVSVHTYRRVTRSGGTP